LSTVAVKSAARMIERAALWRALLVPDNAEPATCK
jgi:hypothetical protein